MHAPHVKHDLCIKINTVTINSLGSVSYLIQKFEKTNKNHDSSGKRDNIQCINMNDKSMYPGNSMQLDKMISMNYSSMNSRPIIVPVKINDRLIDMEFDSGATVSVCSRVVLFLSFPLLSHIQWQMVKKLQHAERHMWT